MPAMKRCEKWTGKHQTQTNHVRSSLRMEEVMKERSWSLTFLVLSDLA